MVKRFIIYKVTNTINNRYYIGRHATIDINDNYLGSGKGIKNAVKKYGVKSFIKEIIAEASTASELWELEEQIVNDDVVNDPLSYNMTYGGRSYLDGLMRYDKEKFIQHQSQAGKLGGAASYNAKDNNAKIHWHRTGGRAAARINKEQRTHPFYTGEAAAAGGRAVKGMRELWNPNSTATNKNQKEYIKGDSLKARFGSEKYKTLVARGWLPIHEHKERIMVRK